MKILENNTMKKLSIDINEFRNILEKTNINLNILHLHIIENNDSSINDIVSKNLEQVQNLLNEISNIEFGDIYIKS